MGMRCILREDILDLLPLRNIINYRISAALLIASPLWYNQPINMSPFSFETSADDVVRVLSNEIRDKNGNYGILDSQ
jgi:hypothetical protein